MKKLLILILILSITICKLSAVIQHQCPTGQQYDTKYGACFKTPTSPSKNYIYIDDLCKKPDGEPQDIGSECGSWGRTIGICKQSYNGTRLDCIPIGIPVPGN